MQLTKAQQLMTKDGFPKGLFLTPEQRKAAWDANPPKPMPTFGITQKEQDPAAQRLLAEIEADKKLKSENKKVKKLDKQIDRTGQRWDGRKGKWINENETRKPMISITTNTRGTPKMKDFAEMTGPELVEAYNKRSGKPPIKKFKDKATGLAAMAKLQSAKPTPKAAKVDKPKTEKVGSENKRAAEFGARVGSFREKLIIALDASYRNMVPTEDLLKAVYGSKNTENTGALTMVLKGAQIMIEKNKLPYELRKEKNEGAISHGLWPK